MDAQEEYVETMTVRRSGRVVAYALMSAAGGLAIFGPPTLIQNQVDSWVAQAWAFCLLISALTCAAGALTDRWIGEYAGLPLLFTVLGLFGIALYLSARQDENFPVYAYSLIILALASKLFARWQDIRELKSEAEHQGCANEGV